LAFIIFGSISYDNYKTFFNQLPSPILAMGTGTRIELSFIGFHANPFCSNGACMETLKMKRELLALAVCVSVCRRVELPQRPGDEIEQGQGESGARRRNPGAEVEELRSLNLSSSVSPVFFLNS
jgi:hypothetical protein